VETPTNGTWKMHKVEKGQIKMEMQITCQSVLACWVIKNTKVSVRGAAFKHWSYKDCNKKYPFSKVTNNLLSPRTH